MEAGRELDLLIAEKIFGLNLYDRQTLKETPITGTAALMSGMNLDRVPRFSTEIAAAWLVVEKTNLLMGYELTQDDKTKKWMIGHGSDGYRFESDFPEGDTAAHVICLATLKPKWCRAREDWVFPS